METFSAVCMYINEKTSVAANSVLDALCYADPILKTSSLELKTQHEELLLDDESLALSETDVIVLDFNEQTTVSNEESDIAVQGQHQAKKNKIFEIDYIMQIATKYSVLYAVSTSDPYARPYIQVTGNTQKSSNTPPATNKDYTTTSEPPREESESDQVTQREESIGQQEQSMHNVNPDAQSMVRSAPLVVNQRSDPVVTSYSPSSKNDLDPSMSMNDVPETDGGEQLESTQETNNASFEESSMSSYPLSSNMTQETGRSFSRDNQQEEILINSFVNDLRKQLEALSKEDLFEVVQNALSRLGLHECIDALVEECGMDAVTNAASKTGNDVMKF
eukprot:g5612.t1